MASFIKMMDDALNVIVQNGALIQLDINIIRADEHSDDFLNTLTLLETPETTISALKKKAWPNAWEFQQRTKY